MKNIKRILSVLVVILLAGMYIASFIFALIDSPDAFECLKISICSMNYLKIGCHLKGHSFYEDEVVLFSYDDLK